MAAGDFTALIVEGATGAFSYSATRPAGAQALSVKMKANEGEKFIAMLSPGAQIPALGPLSANLDWVTGAAETARVNLSVTGAVGEFTWNAQGDPRGGVGLAGIAKLRVARPPSALALVWRGAAPAGADGPLQLNGQLALGPEGGLLEGLAGSLGDDKVTGAVKLNFAQAAPPGADVAIVKDAAAAVGAPEKGHRQRIEGALSFDALNLAAVAQLALSPTAPAANLYDGPDFAIDFAAKSAASPGGAMLQDFKARLTGKLGSIEVADAAATLNGGRISGAANLNRSDGVLSVSGEAAIKQVALPPPFAQGVADIALKFATTGRSAAQLVSGLSGGGTAAMANAKIAKADPSALQRLLKRAVGQDAAPDEAKLLQALGGELDKGALALAEQTVPATLSGGALNVGPAPTPLADGALEATGRFDFGTGALSARIQVIDLEKLKFWRDAPPGFSALYTSGADGVKRQIDVASLASGLSAQALAVSLERTAMFDADIRERAYFVRRDKADKFIARRKAELAAYAAEAARLAAQADPLLVQSAPAPELNAATPQAPPVQGADPAVKSKPTKGAAAAAPDLNGLY